MADAKNMTAAEALEIALYELDCPSLFDNPEVNRIVSELRALGFAIVPVEPDDAAVERMGEATLQLFKSEADESLYACGLMSDEMLPKIARAAILAFVGGA